MRVLVVEPGPAFSVQDVATGWAAGLRHAGCDVKTFNLGDRLVYHSNYLEKREQFAGMGNVEFAQMVARMSSEGLLAGAMTWWPDVVIVVSSFFVPADILRVLRSRGMCVVLHLTESPYEDENQYGMAEHADLVLINDPTNLERFRDANPNTHYQPHGWNPETHWRRPADADAASEFCFVGTGYPSRVEWFESVDFTGIDVALAGNWSGLPAQSPLRKYVAHDIDRCVDNDETALLYSNTAASLNLYRTEALDDQTVTGWAVGPREIELAALGTFFLRQARPESDELFPMLPTVDSPEDFGDKLRWWLAHPTQRDDAARQARDAVADRSYYQHADRLLRLADAIPKTLT